VVRESCIADNYSFTHELGHIMGARHDRFSDGLPSTASGSHFGHVEKTPTPPGTPWYTLMATFRQCTEQAPVLDCDRIPYWSNPDLKSPPASGADALGVADREDNSRRLNDTARVVANFRCSEADDNALRMRDTPEGAAPARAAGAVSSRIRSGPP
jgi:hypothetical protein